MEKTVHGGLGAEPHDTKLGWGSAAITYRFIIGNSLFLVGS